VNDIRTWAAPQPDDDGVSLMAQVLGNIPRKFGRIGWEMGRESIIRMPIADFDRIRAACAGIEFADASPLIWRLRMVKSPAEVTKIERACQIASRAYAALPGQLSIGMDEHEVARLFRAELTRQGADAIPFMAVTSGAGGYDQIIVGPLERKLAGGDVLFIDLGATFDGYFCDFDRNFAVGEIDDETRRVQDIVWPCNRGRHRRCAPRRHPGRPCCGHGVRDVGCRRIRWQCGPAWSWPRPAAYRTAVQHARR
jgi:Xaa-Pro dipeptidase